MKTRTACALPGVHKRRRYFSHFLVECCHRFRPYVVVSPRPIRVGGPFTLSVACARRLWIYARMDADDEVRQTNCP
jgi:hypothetical protein